MSQKIDALFIDLDDGGYARLVMVSPVSTSDALKTVFGVNLVVLRGRVIVPGDSLEESSESVLPP